MSAISPISRDERLAYIDLFYTGRDLAIDSPFHYLRFNEALSPVLQAVKLDQLQELHPTNAGYPEWVWSCCEVVDFVCAKQKLWQGDGLLAQLQRRRGTVMLSVPPLDSKEQWEAGTIETIYKPH